VTSYLVDEPHDARGGRPVSTPAYFSQVTLRFGSWDWADDDHFSTALMDISMTTRSATLLLALAAVSIFVSGCANPYYTKIESPPQRAASSTGSARVYFIGHGGSSWGGSSYAFILREKKLIGYLQPGLMFYVDLPAGEHWFMAESSNADALKASLEGGKTYHVQVYWTPGAMSILFGSAQHAHITPIVRGTEGWQNKQLWMSESEPVRLRPENAREWEFDYAETIAEHLASFKAGQTSFKTMDVSAAE
jgi:hypothetical protein